MKSLKIASIFIVSLFAFTFVSCDDEPLEGDFATGNEETELTCVEATQNLSEISQTYATTPTDDANYAVICNAYAEALQDMIDSCGDNTGAIQTLLDSLNCPAANNNCETAQTATDAAESAYNADNTNTSLCNAYKAALQNEIAQCGDTDGSLQSIIDGLGDCNFNSSSSGDLSVTAGTLNIDFITNSADLSSGVITVNGSNLENGANYLIYFELAENATGVDVMQNFKLTLNNGEYFPNTDGFDDFTNTITVNSGGVIQGSFGGIVSRTDGADLSLSQGVVDLTY